MKEKVCVVTGGTSGVGGAIALGLARLGGTVVLPCRDVDRGESAAGEIVRESGNGAVYAMVCDLSSLESIRAFVDAFASRFKVLHVLSNNAATFPMKRHTTVDGLEMILATNYLGHFLLTNLLLDSLKRGVPSRVITVSGKPRLLRRGRIRFEDIQLVRSFNPIRATLQGALAKVLFSLELARRLDAAGVTSNTFHPGLVRSNLTRHFPWYVKPVVDLFELFAADECPTGVFLASSPEVEGVTGGFFVGRKIVGFDAGPEGEKAGTRLWEMSARLTGLSS
jgi:NAD(P)-dependent dehydrogenase (short-subunit alcohol dehydrogenase family)